MRKRKTDLGPRTSDLETDPDPEVRSPRSEVYRPMVFSEGCELTASEREAIEAQRKDLWKHGIRKQPMLDQMVNHPIAEGPALGAPAFEFGYVICASRAAKEASEHGG